MPTYFLCPSSDIGDTLSFFESNEVKFEWITCSMTRDCIESALAVYTRIPSGSPPLPTDMLLEKASPARDTPAALQADYPSMVFAGRGDVCEIITEEESQERFTARVETAVRCLKDASNTVLIVARPSVVLAYTGVDVVPGHFHKID